VVDSAALSCATSNPVDEGCAESVKRVAVPIHRLGDARVTKLECSH
jgi:hypothetical protein